MKRFILILLIIWANLCTAQTKPSPLTFNQFVLDYLMPTGLFGSTTDAGINTLNNDTNNHIPGRIIDKIITIVNASPNTFFTFSSENSTSSFTSKKNEDDLMGFYKVALYSKPCSNSKGVDNVAMGRIACIVHGEKYQFGQYRKFKRESKTNIHYNFQELFDVPPNALETFFAKLTEAENDNAENGVEFGGAYRYWATTNLGVLKPNTTIQSSAPIDYIVEYDPSSQYVNETLHIPVSAALADADEFYTDSSNLTPQNVGTGDLSWEQVKTAFAADPNYASINPTNMLSSANYIFGDIPSLTIKSLDTVKANGFASAQASSTISGFITTLKSRFKDCTINFGIVDVKNGTMICYANVIQLKFGQYPTFKYIHNGNLAGEFEEIGVQVTSFLQFTNKIFSLAREHKGEYVYMGADGDFFGKIKFSETEGGNDWSFVGKLKQYLPETIVQNCVNGTPGPGIDCPDSDGDGVTDTIDRCPGTTEGTTINSMGCADDDGDGIGNSSDLCLDSLPDEIIGNDGCPLDTDKDGVPDKIDACPDTSNWPSSPTVNAAGCDDFDGDGISDTNDACINTPPNTVVGTNGCSDADNDGIDDDHDSCPNTPTGTVVDTHGCAQSTETILTQAGSWTNSGGRTTTSADNPRFQFDVLTSGTATITLTVTSIESYLYLLSANESIDSQDDIDITKNAKITKNLYPGTYKITCATYYPNQVGDFNLSVTGHVSNLIPIGPPPAQAITWPINGHWNYSGGKNATDRGNLKFQFEVVAEGNTTITLDSTFDNYLYLLNSTDNIIAENDNVFPGSNAKIITSLVPGIYKAVAATVATGVVGNFTLSVNGYISNLVYIEPPALPIVTLTQDGSWEGSGGRDKNSLNNPSYKFTISGGGDTVTIDLSSTTADSYLYLVKDGTEIFYNDNKDDTSLNAGLTYAIPPGTYTIVTATYNPGERGNFNLSVKGNYVSNLVLFNRAPLIKTINGTWVNSGGQIKTAPNPRYQFTTTNQTTDITIDLISTNPTTVDNYLYLLDKYGGVSENYGSPLINDKIVAYLTADTYTIVAATNLPGQNGNFTLTVTGQDISGLTLVASPPPESPAVWKNLSLSGTWISSGGMSKTSTGNPHYNFTVTKQDDVGISLMSSEQSGIDNYLLLLNSTGTVLSQNNTGGGDSATDAVINMRNLSPGNYTIVAGTYYTGESGEFVIMVDGYVKDLILIP